MSKITSARGPETFAMHYDAARERHDTRPTNMLQFWIVGTLERTRPWEITCMTEMTYYEMPFEGLILSYGLSCIKTDSVRRMGTVYPTTSTLITMMHLITLLQEIVCRSLCPIKVLLLIFQVCSVLHSLEWIVARFNTSVVGTTSTAALV